MDTEVCQYVEGHEGYRRFPYLDTTGNLTIGYGRNLNSNPLTTTEIKYLNITVENILGYLEQNGITPAQATYLLSNDLNKVVTWLSNYSWYEQLSNNRKTCLIDMGYNLGESGFAQFTDMIHFISVGSYTAAATAMKNSLWYVQVGSRAEDDIKLMLVG